MLAQVGKLDNAKSIYTAILAVQDKSSGDSIRKTVSLAKLRYAEVSALLGDVELRYNISFFCKYSLIVIHHSSKIYEEISKSSNDLVIEASDSSTYSRVRSRMDTLEIVAIGCSVFSTIQNAKVCSYSFQLCFINASQRTIRSWLWRDFYKHCAF